MSTAGPVMVLARWSMSDERVEEVLALVAALRQPTLAEPSCLRYDVFRSVDQPGELLLVEGYADDAALEAHRRSPHYEVFVMQRILPLLTRRSVELLTPRI